MDEGLNYRKLVWSMVCKIFFGIYVLPVKGFINLKLGTRAFCLTTFLPG
jgi:hypothetical protein